MLKTFSKYAHVAATLGLALSLAAMPAHAKPTSSFKSGFSSQRSSSPAPSKGSFGSFNSRPSSRNAGADGAAAGKSGGGFGAFSGAPASGSRGSDSALSRKLDRESSEANALRTLDQRRAAQAAREARESQARESGDGMRDGAPRDARTPPAPGYGYNNGYNNGYNSGYGNAPAQPPVIVNQGGGISMGQVIAGAVIANSVANAHARNSNANNNNAGKHGDSNGGGYYPAPGGDAGNLANRAGAGSVGGTAAAPPAPAAPAAPKAAASGASVFGTIVWLGVLALLGWVAYRVWKRARARRAADKPNYSFERN